MAQVSLPESAFIEVVIDWENGNLPDKFATVLAAHIASTPASFYLPWPLTLIPSQGDDISMSSIVGTLSEIRVENVSYQYTKEGGIIAYVTTSSDWDAQDFDLQALHCFAQQGFLLEDKKSMKEVLEEAGLWQPLDEEYKK